MAKLMVMFVLFARTRFGLYRFA